MTTYYSEDHEWITVEGDTATVGITAHAAVRTKIQLIIRGKPQLAEVCALPFVTQNYKR